MSSDFLHETPSHRNFRMGVLVVAAVALVAGVVWMYSSEQEQTVATEEVTTDSVLRQLAINSPFDSNQVYFADEGLSISGAALNTMYLDDVRQMLEFEFTLVPDILDIVALHPPLDTDEGDLQAYQTIQAGGEPPAREAEFVPPNYEYTYIEFVEASEHAETIHDMRNEVAFLIMAFHDEFDRPALHERMPEDVTQTADPIPLPLNQNGRTVYPNFNAGQAFFYYELFSRLHPDLDRAYHDYALVFAAHGLYHGLYGKSDVDATESLVHQYFDAYEDKHGPLSEQFTDLAEYLNDQNM